MKVPLLILLSIPLSLKAQFFVEPSIGLQYPMCSFTSGKFKNFRVNTFDELFDWGIGFRWVKPSGNELYLGINNRSVGFSFGVTVPEDLVKNPYSSPKRRHSTSIGMDNLSFSYRGSFHKNIWRNSDDNGKQKHFGLTLKEGIGVSALYIPDIYNIGDTLQMEMVGLFADTISYTNNTEVVKHWGASVDLFLSLSVRNNISNKELFSATIYYSQGLLPLMRNDVEYVLNSRKGTAHLVSRGSSMGLCVQVPIRVSKKQKNEIYKLNN